MELSLTFLATGIAIVVYHLWRARRLGKYSTLTESLASDYDVTDLDRSGDTSYTNCTSHRWVIDNLGRKKHGKLGSKLQERLFDKTLSTFIFIAFILGSGALIIGILLIRSIEVAGMSIFVILVGVLVILGPGDTKVSEELLLELSNHKIQELCREDYVYAQLALDSVRKWITRASVIGIAVIVISPWAEAIPMGIALAVSSFTTYIIWNPALVLSEISWPLAITYLVIVFPVMLYAITRVYRRIRRSYEESEGSSIQW
ncbi:MAG: hypothetical protein ACW98Y_03730 [Candidatus Thorarchaeota archaeon]